MPIPTVYRHYTHTDAEHEARVNGTSAGWTDASFEDAYGDASRQARPDRFDAPHLASVWDEAYQDGRDSFDSMQEDEAIYGHDWRGEDAPHVGHRSHFTGAWYCDTCDSPYCDLA